MTAFTFVFQPTRVGAVPGARLPFEPRGAARGSSSAREETWRAPGSTARRGAERALLREAVRRAPGRAEAADQPLDLAHVPDHPLRLVAARTTSCCSATPRTPRTSRSARAPSSRWRTRSRSPTPCAPSRRRAEGAAGLRGGAPPRRAEGAARGADEPRVVREQRALHGQHPERFVFNLMTRSKRITYENLRLRDPALVARGSTRWPRRARGSERRAPRPPPRCSRRSACAAAAAEPRRGLADVPVLGDRRRGPTTGTWCTSAAARGRRGPRVHRDDRRLAEGRITPGCAGIWNDTQAAAWRASSTSCTATAEREDRHAARHAGRKGSCSRPWEGDRRCRPAAGWPLGPSAAAVPARLAGAARDGRGPTWTRVLGSSSRRPRWRAAGLRHARAAHGARLPAVELPVAAHQPCAPTPTAARSRTAALPARGVRRRARRVARATSPQRAHLGDRLDSSGPSPTRW
jgi:hypothetical protein